MTLFITLHYSITKNFVSNYMVFVVITNFVAMCWSITTFHVKLQFLFTVEVNFCDLKIETMSKQTVGPKTMSTAENFYNIIKKHLLSRTL